jgi:NACalpha-BTF3-like transcription factor
MAVFGSGNGAPQASGRHDWVPAGARATEAENQQERMEVILENGSKSSDLVTGDKIKAVRKETRAGTIDCRKALESTGGDVQKAVEYLRERGIGTPKKVWT